MDLQILSLEPVGKNRWLLLCPSGHLCKFNDKSPKGGKSVPIVYCVIGVSLKPLSISHEITKSFILSMSIIILLTLPNYDYDQRHWRQALRS
jgi:hypothetical protein